MSIKPCKDQELWGRERVLTFDLQGNRTSVEILRYVVVDQTGHLSPIAVSKLEKSASLEELRGLNLADLKMISPLLLKGVRSNFCSAIESLSQAQPITPKNIDDSSSIAVHAYIAKREWNERVSLLKKHVNEIESILKTSHVAKVAFKL